MDNNSNDDDQNLENLNVDTAEEEESSNDFYSNINYNFANYDYNYANINNYIDSDDDDNIDPDYADSNSNISTENSAKSEYFKWTIENFRDQPDHLESSPFRMEQLNFTLGISFDDSTEEDESEDSDSEEINAAINIKRGSCIINLSNIKETLHVHYILRLVNARYENRCLQAEFSKIITSDTPTLRTSYNIKLNREMIEDNRQGWIDKDGNLTLDIQILAVPEYIPDFTGKNSKKETGYVGLKNQGATCYMNSMLQALFHLPAFRRIVYNMETSTTEDPEKCIPLCLQKLFCQLQFRDVACSTKTLTKSFGWTDMDSIMQHDVQEFCRVLIDNLEMKMKGTELENSIPKLFKGRTRSYIRCINVNYESSKIEEFYDLSMLVKGCKNLQESFEKYIEKEKMDGDNQYNTEEFGKQDAEMGVEFIEFPSVLHLHLRRFEYDYETGMMIKINDRFEFPEEIDLSPYLAKDAKEGNSNANKSNIYDLYGVLVHFGSYESGHYYAFLRTSTDPQWYKFDDCCVTKEIPKMAIQDNFGGSIYPNYASKVQNSPLGGYAGYAYQYARMKRYSGYMLVYVRRDDADRIFMPISENEIPGHLIDYVQQVEREAKMKKEQQIEESNTLNINIISQNDLENWSLQGNLGFPNRAVSCPPLRMNVSMTTKDLYETFAEHFHVDVDQIRIWETNLYHNPSKVIPNRENVTLQKLRSSYYWNDVTVYVEMKDKIEPLLFPQEKSLVLFIMFYFPQANSPIQYVGNISLEKTATVADSIPKVNSLLEFPSSTQLLVFDETISGSLKKLENESKFVDLGVNTGSILIFQVAPGHEIPETPFEFKEPLEIQLQEQQQDQIQEENKANEKQNSETNLNDIDINSDSDSFDLSSSDSSEFSSDFDDLEDEKSTESKKKKKNEPKIEDQQIPFISADDIYPTKIETVDQYLDKKNNTVKVDVYNYDDPIKVLFTLQFKSSMHYDEFKMLIAKAAGLQYNPSHDSMLLYLTDSKKKKPKGNPLETSLTPSPKSLFRQQQFSNRQYSNLLNYEISGSNSVLTDSFAKKLKKSKEKRFKFFFQLYNGISEDQISKMTNYNVVFSRDGYNIDEKVKLLQRKSLTCKELLLALKKKGIDISENVPYRFFQLYDHKIHIELSPDMRANSSYYTTRIEIIPEDQRKLKSYYIKSEIENEAEKNDENELDIPKPKFNNENEIVDIVDENEKIKKGYKVVSEFLIEFCYVSYRYLGCPHGRGDPFIVKVIPGEKFSDTKERIRKCLKEPQLSRFNRSKFEIGPSNFAINNKMRVVNDDDILSEIAQPDDRVTMVSKKQEEKRKNLNNLCDASVKIFN